MTCSKLTKTDTGLSLDTIKSIRSCFEAYPEIETAILYGSRAKGNYKNDSDIDLCLKGRSLNLKLTLRILNDLEDIALAYQFDLCVYHQIEDKDLIEHIDRVGINFYTNPSSII